MVSKHHFLVCDKTVHENVDFVFAAQWFIENRFLVFSWVIWKSKCNKMWFSRVDNSYSQSAAQKQSVRSTFLRV